MEKRQKPVKYVHRVAWVAKDHRVHWVDCGSKLQAILMEKIARIEGCLSAWSSYVEEKQNV